MSQWQKWSEKFFELTQREKIIIAFTVVFLITYGLHFALIKPIYDKQKRLISNESNYQQQVNDIRVQITDIQNALRQDPNEPIKIEITSLRAELDKVEKRLDTIMTQYVAPDQMAKELTRLLSTETSLRVVGLSTKPPIRLQIARSKVETNESSSAEAVDIPELYSHHFELVVTGEYFPLMNFVKKVLSKNDQFAVNELKYEVLAHPKAQMTMSLVTISDSENVIRL
jgi:MSHA biogenesis protein MshJ